ncbi:MAG: hypothetical protein ABWZ80_00400 [Beijerinckiaceae bacterium]
MTTRRNLIASIAGLAATAVAQRAQAQGAAISDVRVDVSPLRAKGWGGAPLGVIDQNLRAGLRQAFADRIGQGGPLLVVRIDAVSLSGYAGGLDSGGRGSFGGGPSAMVDYMDGELVMVGRGNAILSRTPLLSTYPSSISGPWFAPDIDLRRLASLSTSYARWARWKLS